MQTDIVGTKARPQGNRQDVALIVAFGLFSYFLLSIWGYLVARDPSVALSPRRLVVCAIGAGIFWLTLTRLRRRPNVDLGALLASIVVAGLTILLVRLGIDQLSTSPIEPEHSVRWSLAWSGYFGIWLLAAVPPGPPSAYRAGRTATDGRPGTTEAVPDVYFEQLLALPGEDGERTP